ncbi:MAG: NAD-dependent malic enzyme [Deltaproteobacteria bacterium]|nr:NAD-dependent malic enzyme [Deltaproteobacteria bacterium]
MSTKRKIIRTLRCKNKKNIGVLAALISTMSALGADIGDIKTVKFGELFNFRDISILIDNEDHLNTIVQAVRKLQNVELEAVIDDVLETHRGGKIEIHSRAEVKSIEDLRKIYTPGVASVCNLIFQEPKNAQTYTSIGKNVALITNGSRVLGLGNIGAVAAMPVMEGKAALFKQFTGYNMIPILLNTRDVETFISTVETIAPTFSAIQLEDISAPHCFTIEERLKKSLPIPVMHDDQHGTAVVVLAALISTCKIMNHDLKKLKVGQIGLGAAGQAMSSLIMKYSGNTVLGTDLGETAVQRFESQGGVSSSLNVIMNECDVVMATTGRAGLIKPSMIKKGSIIFSLSNPEPEITIEDAMKAGAAFASDGSRVNNLLGYPGIFKGALEAKAFTINQEMLIAAAEALVSVTPEGDVIPDVLDQDVHTTVAKWVMKAAIHTKVTQDFN